MRVQLPSRHEVAIAARRTVSVGAISIVLVGGCRTVPGPNPAGLPEEARTLEYILDRGCLAYILGEKTEDEAMRGVHLHHQEPGPGFFQPPGSPRWLGLYPGLSSVVVGQTICSLNMKGAGNFAAYRTATQAVLHRRLGADAEEDVHSPYRKVLPGQIVGCRRDVAYTYYATRRIFSVNLSRGGHCSKIE